MNLDELASKLEKMAVDKYGTIYKLSKETGLPRIYIYRNRVNPTLSNIFTIAEACGFEVELSIKQGA